MKAACGLLVLRQMLAVASSEAIFIAAKILASRPVDPLTLEMVCAFAASVSSMSIM